MLTARQLSWNVSLQVSKNASQEDALARGTRPHMPLLWGGMCQNTRTQMGQIKALLVPTGWLASDKL